MINDGVVNRTVHIEMTLMRIDFYMFEIKLLFEMSTEEHCNNVMFTLSSQLSLLLKEWNLYLKKKSLTKMEQSLSQSMTNKIRSEGVKKCVLNK